MSVDLSRGSILSAPRHDPTSDWGRDQDRGLYRHHGRSGHGAGSTLLEPVI